MLWTPKRRLALFIVVACSAILSCASLTNSELPWSKAELALLQSLWLEDLPPHQGDLSNRYVNDPRAIDLGKNLFFDKRLSANGKISCATCHQPELYFTDGLQRSRGISEVKRNASSLLGTAYSPWLYWDGRRDSHWAQALVPLETPAEHGLDRKQALRVIFEDPDYLLQYRAIFNLEPNPNLLSEDHINRNFANIGKSIAAFESRLMPTPSRFDHYVAELLGGPLQEQPFDSEEINGLKLFISDQAQCTRCHNGPLFSNFGFHNIGLVELKRGVTKYDFGRIQGIDSVLQDPFNCLGEYSDATTNDCKELEFIKTKGVELVGAFKVPGLRNVAMTAPYMHDGRFNSLNEVIAHYREAPTGRAGHQELNPISLDAAQASQLIAFLKTLTGATPHTDHY